MLTCVRTEQGTNIKGNTTAYKVNGKRQKQTFTLGTAKVKILQL